MKFLILLVYVQVLMALDYSEEAKKYIDPDVDPCFDFYRHVCRVNSTIFLGGEIGEMIKKENQKAAEANTKIFPEFAELEDDNKNQVTEQNIPNLISSTYKTICEFNLDTEPYLSELEMLFKKGPECQTYGCFTHLAKDSNCERVAEHINQILDKMIPPVTTAIIIESHDEMIKIVRNLDSFWAKDDLSRESEFQSYFQEMKNVAADLIMETPWAQNHNVSEMILSVLDRVFLTNHFEAITNELVNMLKEVNTMYSECKTRYDAVPKDLATQYCLYFATLYTTKNSPRNRLKTIDMDELFLTARINYPKIEIGYIWYQMFLTTKNRAARLGSPGFTIAHELSHSLIRETKGDLLSYFSEEVKECIQEQYRSTCTYFDEGNCEIGQQHFEENGADVFAVQIVWKLFEQHFVKEENEIEEIESSEDLRQLFYAMGTNLCSGQKQVYYSHDPHAAGNLRVNAIVNHPAFQKAFQCSDDSRMMQSKTKQCSVYGEHAPLNRHRRDFPTRSNRNMIRTHNL